MVFVKVRETYDLHTVKNKMSVIAIHTPNPSIIKDNFPGLLMQCKTYRPYSCDVRLACASMLPVDPLGVGTTQDDIAPEDLFNPLLYKAMSNMGMSQLEARINAIGLGSATAGDDLNGNSAAVETDSLTNKPDEFDVYYGILANAHGWKHAAPQSGLSMTGLKPLVYEVLYNYADSWTGGTASTTPAMYPEADQDPGVIPLQSIRGNGKPLPMLNCTSYSTGASHNPFVPTDAQTVDYASFRELSVPWINCVVGAVIVPPSRLHELFYRMVVEWTIEFSQIRPLSEVTTWNGLVTIGQNTHYQNYDYSSAKEAITGSKETILENDTTMVSTTTDIKKVM